MMDKNIVGHEEVVEVGLFYDKTDLASHHRANSFTDLFASDTDNPHKAPAALSCRPGEAFEHDCARVTWQSNKMKE